MEATVSTALASRYKHSLLRNHTIWNGVERNFFSYDLTPLATFSVVNFRFLLATFATPFNCVQTCALLLHQYMNVSILFRFIFMHNIHSAIVDSIKFSNSLFSVTAKNASPTK